MKFQRIYPRDVIALLVLAGVFVGLAFGYNGWLQGIGAVIIGYYFSKRVFEENKQ